MHEDGEYDLPNEGVQLGVPEKTVESFYKSVSQGKSLEEALDPSSLRTLAREVTGNPKLDNYPRFLNLSRDHYKRTIGNPEALHASKKSEGRWKNPFAKNDKLSPEDVWKDFTKTLGEEWRQSIKDTQNRALEYLTSDEISKKRESLWDSFKGEYVDSSSTVISAEHSSEEIDPILSDAIVEEQNKLSAVDSEKFWDDYRNIVGTEHPNKTIVAMEVVPAIDIEGMDIPLFAKPDLPGVIQYEDQEIPIDPRLYIFDATNPENHFMNGESNRIAGAEGKHHMLASKIHSNNDKDPLKNKKCYFCKGSGGELMMVVPYVSSENNETTYISYLVTSAKFVISDEIDDRKPPASVRPAF